jgi:hypothetical protein
MHLQSGLPSRLSRCISTSMIVYNGAVNINVQKQDFRRRSTSVLSNMLIVIDDGERLSGTLELLASAFLTGLLFLEEKDMLKPRCDSPIPNIGLMAASFFRWFVQHRNRGRLWSEIYPHTKLFPDLTWS